MTEETTQSSLAMFEPLKAELAKWEEINKTLVFNYETAKGESEARSQVYKFRQAKGKIKEVHQQAKKEALAHCQAVDGEKNLCLARVEKMIAVHMDPIDAKIKRRKDAEAAAAEKLRAEAETEEKKRVAEIAAREEASKQEAERGRDLRHGPGSCRDLSRYVAPGDLRISCHVCDGGLGSYEKT